MTADFVKLLRELEKGLGHLETDWADKMSKKVKFWLHEFKDVPANYPRITDVCRHRYVITMNFHDAEGWSGAITDRADKEPCAKVTLCCLTPNALFAELCKDAKLSPNSHQPPEPATKT